MVTLCWPRCFPCPCILNHFIIIFFFCIELRKLRDQVLVYSIRIVRATKFVQMMISGWVLTLLKQDQTAKTVLMSTYNIGIEHGFSCINIRQVPRDLAYVNWKNIFDHYYCIKTENICYISRYSLHYYFRLFTDVSRTQCPRTMLILGPGTTHLVTTAILWPQYRHIDVA